MSEATPVAEPAAPGAVEPSVTPAEPHPSSAFVADDSAIVPVPVPAHVRQPKGDSPDTHLAGAPPELQQQTADFGHAPEPTSPPRPGLLQRFKGLAHWCKSKRRDSQDAQELSEPPPDAGHGIIVSVLDFVLRIVNWPFAFVSPGARHLVGLAAVVTLAIAAVTAALAPLLPRNDALTFLQQKRAELDRPVPPPAPAHGEQPPAGGGHGAGH